MTPVMERPVTFRGTEKLLGILTAPETPSGTGVLFLHGWSGYRNGPHRLFVSFARTLARHGITSLRFDLAGRGDSRGAYTATTLDIMIDDALAAVSFMRSLPTLRTLVMCGICSGANVALGAASLDGGIDGLALLSAPLFVLQRRERGTAGRTRLRVLGRYLRKAFSPRTWKRLLGGEIDTRAVRKAIASGAAPLPEQDCSRDVMDDLRRFTGRILFVYGDRDVAAVDAPDYYRTFVDRHGIAASFETVPGADHNFYASSSQRTVVTLISRWISSPPV
jgi:pimeloyl-ACP methyl ester carboxylesterase